MLHRLSLTLTPPLIKRPSSIFVPDTPHLSGQIVFSRSDWKLSGNRTDGQKMKTKTCRVLLYLETYLECFIKKIHIWLSQLQPVFTTNSSNTDASSAVWTFYITSGETCEAPWCNIEGLWPRRQRFSVSQASLREVELFEFTIVSVSRYKFISSLKHRKAWRRHWCSSWFHHYKTIQRSASVKVPLFVCSSSMVWNVLLRIHMWV